jgi:hypothetical protein
MGSHVGCPISFKPIARDLGVGRNGAQEDDQDQRGDGEGHELESWHASRTPGPPDLIRRKARQASNVGCGIRRRLCAPARRDHPQETEDPMKHGDFTHIEIPADDTGRARRFYSELFGWQYAPETPGFEGYHVFQTASGEEATAGAIGKRGEMAPDKLRVYVHVDSIDEVAA